MSYDAMSYDAPTHVRTGRRTVVRTAAWTVPAVTLASAAPAFAATGQPDFSTSTLDAQRVTRTPAGTGSRIDIPFESATIVNSGGDGDGVVITMSITSGVITQLYLQGDPAGNYGAVTGLGTPTASLTSYGPLSGNVSLPNPALGADTSSQDALGFSFQFAPLPEGAPTAFPSIPFPAL